MRNYKQLSQAQRYQIEILKKAGKDQKQIAVLVPFLAVRSVMVAMIDFVGS